MTVRTVGVVGTGIGRAHIVDGYLAHPDRFAVTALCDLDPIRLAAVADEFAIPRRYTAFADLLADPGIEIVDICTPPGSHLELVLEALAAGKHVVCEKPLAGSLAEVDAIMTAEASAPGVLMPVFQYRYGTGIEQVRRVIAAGIAGKPYLGTVETLWLRKPEYYAVPWRGKWASELGGALVGHAIHLHDLLTELMGPVARVFGRIATRVNAIEVEDCATASLEMASGALVSLSCTLGSQEEISRLRLHFEHVTFESGHAPYSPGDAPWRILAANGDIQARIDRVIADSPRLPHGFATQMSRLHDHLAGQGPLPVTSRDARTALELVTAIYRSSATGMEVVLPLVPGTPGYDDWRPDPAAR